MPIEADMEFTPVGQEQFHAIDKGVMRHVFDIHNTLGRFYDERIYQEELAYRCRASGLEAHREVPLLRQLRTTRLGRLHWLNLDQRNIELQTLSK